MRGNTGARAGGEGVAYVDNRDAYILPDRVLFLTALFL